MSQPATEADLVPSLSVPQQLLVAQAVHQTRSTSSPPEPVDWSKVSDLLTRYLVPSQTHQQCPSDHFGPEVCRHAYSNLCSTYLDKSNHLLEPQPALAIARRLYEKHIKIIVDALQEEDKRYRSLSLEVEAIKRGDWDDKLRATAQSEQTVASDSPSTTITAHLSPPKQSIDPKATGEVEASGPHVAGEPKTYTAKTLSVPGSTRPLSKRRSASPRERSPGSKDIQSRDISAELSTSNDRASQVPEVTRARKRKVRSGSISQRKVITVSKPEHDKREPRSTVSGSPKKQKSECVDSARPDNTAASNEKEVSNQTPGPSPARPAEEPLVHSPSPDLDDQAIERALTKPPSPSPSGAPQTADPVAAVNADNKTRDLTQPEDDETEVPMDLDSPMAPSEHSVKNDERRVTAVPAHSDKRASRVAAPSPSQDSKAALKSSADSGEADQLAVSKASQAAVGESAEMRQQDSVSTAPSPNSAKRLRLDLDHSIDGSHAGTPNSASFPTGVTEGSSTAQQTPNSAKLPLPLADSSVTKPTPASTGSSDPTSFRRRMLKTHSSVQSNPISAIFREPVKESDAPGYALIVKRPMDLRTLAKKLRDGKVTTTEEYRRDLMLMLANAVMFNHEDSEVSKSAKELMIECDRLVSIFMRGSRY